MNITNNKLKELNNWADFRGFSLLFDNPEGNLKTLDCGLFKINCSPRDPQLKFYYLLNNLLKEIIPQLPAKNHL